MAVAVLAVTAAGLFALVFAARRVPSELRATSALQGTDDALRAAADACRSATEACRSATRALADPGPAATGTMQGPPHRRP